MAKNKFEYTLIVPDNKSAVDKNTQAGRIVSLFDISEVLQRLVATCLHAIIEKPNAWVQEADTTLPFQKIQWNS